MFFSNRRDAQAGPAQANRLWRLGVQKFLGGLFLAMLIAASLSLTLIGYRIVSKRVERSAIRRSNAITRAIVRELDLSVNSPIQSFINRAAHGALGEADTLEKRLERLPLLQQVLQANYFAKGVIIGFDNGDFFATLVIESDQERQVYQTPTNSVLMVLDCRGPLRTNRARALFYDQDLNFLGERPSPRYDYHDARTRDWYKEAMRSESFVETGPYLFRPIQRQGIIVSERTANGKAVLGMMVDLQQISDILNSERPTSGSELALFNGDGIPVAGSHVLASQHNGSGRIWETQDFPLVIQKTMGLYKEGQRGANLPLEVEGKEWLVSLEELRHFFPTNYVLAVAIPRGELFAESDNYFRDSVVGLFGLLMLTATLMWLVARDIGRPLKSLAEQAASRSPVSENGGHPAIHGMSSGVAEIRAVASGMNSLHFELRKILGLLASIGTEMDMSHLLDTVIHEIVGMVNVHGGVLVLWDGHSETPGDVRAYWRDAVVTDLKLPGRNQSPRLVMYDAMERGMTQRTTVYRGDIRADFGPVRPIFQDNSTVRGDVIIVPIRDRGGYTLGAFSLLKRVQDNQEDVDSFPPELAEFGETLAVAIGLVLETRTLIKDQQNLRDALMHILAGAIDAKSPYTGSHCARVPIIFHLLLQAANDAEDGAMRDFRLDKNGWEAARLAAWLHDCGKVTTPEYVVDKATKLETLYNRIHEIRTRFEVLKRDVEIASLRAIIAGADAQEERRKMENALRHLDEDFAFVASCNIGGENLDEDDAARLAAIGNHSWTRTLDKRLGVSREELARMEKAGVAPAPVCETLLADQPEHIIPRGEKDRLPADNQWGFKLKMPEALYNRGELHNLLITRGTLTAEERYKINDHITQTIIMLEKLPLPKALAEVPKIAGVHHERMDGTGYPRGLKREEMSLPGRMLAIADIFEALTASDRPYKPMKKLSEALQIMEGMKMNGHIDPDLYDLFINSKIPQRYATEYLTTEQNDM